MRLRERIWDNSTTHGAIEAIGDFLDGLSGDERLAETRSLGRDDQRKLYEKAAKSAPLDLDYFVSSKGPRVEVIHDGRNTLPLPNHFKLFQKRFCRPEQGEGRLFGYNEAPIVNTIGPGYFVAIPTEGHEGWPSRGAVVVDYFQVPDGPVVDGWPKVKPNSSGLQMFVYNKTRDFMRRVSSHVSIGAAYKVEKALDHYFVLCRQA